MSSLFSRIVIGLSGSTFDQTVSELALRLALAHNAKLDAYLIRPVPDDPQVLLMSGYLGDSFKNFFEETEKSIKNFDTAARSEFERSRANYPSVQAIYHNPFKDLAREFATVVWASDIAIMAHPALVNLHFYKAAVLDAIADSARPVLLVPNEKKLGDLKRVMVAWRPDTHHARALASSLPFLKQAEAVTLVSRQDDDYLGTSNDIALQFLEDHGVIASPLTIDDDRRFTPALVDQLCDQHEISLLVIGGGLQSDLMDSMISGIGRRASRKPGRAILAIG